MLVTTLTYDTAGNRLTELDRRGILTESSYDAENRRTRTARAGVELESLEYDANGNVILQTDANGNVTSFEYEERGLVIAQNRPLAAITRTTYDDMGDVTRLRDPEGRIVIRTYDARRRMATETLAAETSRPETTTFEYDLNGNRTLVRRPSGNGWTFAYDHADRLTTVTDPEQGVTTYTWNKSSNLETHADGNGNPTTMAYDERDRPIRKEYADSAFETTAYDDNSNVVERRDALGRLTAFTYDALNRQTEVTLPEDTSTPDPLQSIVQTYDENNNLLEVHETFSQSGIQTTTRTYDAFDRLETVTDRWNNRLRHAYDANGNRTQLTDPSGQATSYSHDALNRLSTVTTSAGVTEYSYFRDGRIKKVTYPNATNANYVYDAAGRTTSIENRHNTSLVSRFAYEYDLNGNRKKQIEEHSGQASETTTYDYDLADRLRQVVYPDKTTTYTYDDVGNRESEEEVDLLGNLITDKAFSYNSRNQLEQLDNLLDSTRSVAYGYDANGNRISRAQGSEVTEFRFDTLDRLAQVTKDGLALSTYHYDAQGLRIEKRTDDSTARYVYDQDSVLTRTDADGTTKFEYGPDRLLSLNDPTEGRAFYLFDALGSVTDLMTPEGTLLARYKYDAWGNFRDATSTAANPFGFTGHEHDDETGLIYAKARFYDPEVGLFLSEDPAAGELTNPPSLHRYLYAFQNPTIFVDPDGRQSEDESSENRRLILLAPDEVPPPGSEITTIGKLRFLVVKDENRTETSEQEDAGLLNRIVTFFTEKIFETRDDAEETLTEAKELDQILGRGLRSDPPLDVESMDHQPATLGETNEGLEIVSESAKKTGVVLKKAGETALAAEEASSRIGILGMLKGIGKRFLKGRLRKEIREEASEQIEESVIRGAKSASSAGLTRVESSIAEEARSILSSPEFAELRAAQQAGRAAEVRIGGKTILFEPDAPVSGMTLFGEDGFIIGQEAFTSEAELTKTVLQETFRLRTSQVGATGVASQAAATAETSLAADFANRAFDELFK